MLFDVMFPVIGTAVAAFVVWQTVRSMNRRPNRKGIAWATAGMVLVVLYVLSFGPAYWWQHSSGSRVIPIVYAPLVETGWRSPRFVLNGLTWYATCTGYDSDKRLGCSPLWRNGPRAFSWISVRVPSNPTSPAPNAPPESN
jgi:hypothetical protein